jgi:hypothetical protein
MLNTAKATPETNKYNKYTHDNHEFKKNKLKELFTGYKPRIITKFDVVTKIPLKFKPWSALYGRVTRGSQLPTSAHKDLPLPVTTPLTR